MNISQFNRKITLQQPARVSNGKGGFDKSWSSFRDVHAQMIPLRGNEALSDNLLREVQLWKVMIRFIDGVTPDWRILFDGRVLNIRSCEDMDGGRRFLTMTCESGVRT